jgi:hypothetical protein
MLLPMFLFSSTTDFYIIICTPIHLVSSLIFNYSCIFILIKCTLKKHYKLYCSIRCSIIKTRRSSIYTTVHCMFTLIHQLSVFIKQRKNTTICTLYACFLDPLITNYLHIVYKINHDIQY